MSQHDTLTQALQQIADWNSHTTEYAVDYGSNGVRDFYRNIARAALSATQPAQAAVAQGAGEVAAWQASDGGSSYISNEARSRNSAFRELYTIPLYTQPASGADVPPAQPAPVVPDGWKLVPIKCTEAMKDVGGQFEFATISDGRLLAQSMWNELLCATPTPPAQAAADARDAERYRWLRDQANTSVNIDIGAGCEISDTLDAAIDAVLATHQQRQGGGA